MQQPSAQGIASLFRGNPQPLQQRIQQEQQAKPGLPPDLQKLLALNIVTNEKDAVAKQQAMQQLQQMQGPQGQQEPPTVMQTVQEQARQKMQAQAIQEQQKQQGLQALMQQSRSPQVPENTPQPEAQPQGIDELPVDFQMAGGGIVAFEKGGSSSYETPYDRMNRENRGELTEEERRKQEEREALLAQIPNGGQTITGGERVNSSELERNILNTLAALPGAGASKATTLGRQALAGIANLIGMDKANKPEDEQAPRLPEASTGRTPAENRSALNAADAALRSAPAQEQVTRRPQKEATSLRDLAELQQPRQARPPQVAPAPAPASVAQQETAAPVPESLAMQVLGKSLASDPMAARVAEQELRKKEVGAPDTSQYDRLIDELEKRKSQFEGPKDQWGQLMEYFGQIAATPRGLSSFEAGAQGAAGVKKLQEARQLEQYNLTKQAVEVSQKKLDTVRAFAEKQYDVGKSAFDDEYKKQFDAAKLIANNEQEARKLAQENTLKRLEISSKEKMAQDQNETSIMQSRIGQAKTYAEEARNKQYQDLMALSRKQLAAGDKAGAQESAARAADIAAISGRVGSAGVAAGPKPMTRDQASDNVAKKLDIANPNRKQIVSDATQALRASGISSPTFAQVEEHLIQEQMKGVALSPQGGGAFTVMAGGRAYTFPTQEAANKFKAEAGVK